MALTPQYSRISHHAISTAGATFHVPLGEDFTIIGGTLSWNVTGIELADREFGVNTTDNKAYVRIGSNINELLFVGGTANDQSFAETLAINNNSQGYSVIMGTSTYIRSTNGGGQIELDSTVNGGGAGSIYLSTDNGGHAETGMFLEPGGNGACIYSYDGNITLETKYSGVTLIESGASSGSLKLSTSWLDVSDEAIFIKNNTIVSVTSSNSNKGSSMISSKNSSFASGVNNSAIIGGSGITAKVSNSVYVPNIYIQETKKIKSPSHNGYIQLEKVSGTPFITLDSAGGEVNIIQSSQNSIKIGPDPFIGNQVVSVTGTFSINNPSVSSYNGSWWNFVTAELQDSGTVSTQIGQTIPMSNGDIITMKATISGFDAFNDLGYGATIMGVFKKSFGSITQISTLDKVEKSEFSTATSNLTNDGSTGIKFTITGESPYTINWIVRYEYIITHSTI